MPSLLERILEMLWPPAGRVPTPQVQPAGSAPPPPPGGGSPSSPKKPDPSQCRPWRLTEYYLASQDDYSGPSIVPILDRDARKIASGSVGFFSSLALEGSGVCDDGRLLNVAGGWVRVDPADYAAVATYHMKYLPHRDPSYSGIQMDGGRVTKALAFYEVPHDKFGRGFGVVHGIPLDPYRTLAADIGKGKKSDPAFKGLGGVVPVGTRVYILELDGKTLPDGSVHDGWCVVNDTGGGIFGAHFDVFIGHRAYEKQFRVPGLGHIWFEGIEKLPVPYEYGLKDQ